MTSLTLPCKTLPPRYSSFVGPNDSINDSIVSDADGTSQRTCTLFESHLLLFENEVVWSLYNNDKQGYMTIEGQVVRVKIPKI